MFSAATQASLAVAVEAEAGLDPRHADDCMMNSQQHSRQANSKERDCTLHPDGHLYVAAQARAYF